MTAFGTMHGFDSCASYLESNKGRNPHLFSQDVSSPASASPSPGFSATVALRSLLSDQLHHSNHGQYQDVRLPHRTRKEVVGEEEEQ